jgi:hypothetical protein
MQEDVFTADSLVEVEAGIVGLIDFSFFLAKGDLLHFGSVLLLKRYE